jgi:hypothetical protein
MLSRVTAAAGAWSSLGLYSVSFPGGVGRLYVARRGACCRGMETEERETRRPARQPGRGFNHLVSLSPPVCRRGRHERRLCEELELHLAYRWFCKLDLDDKVPHHSTFLTNRLDR